MKDIKFWHRVKLPDGSYTPGAVMYGPDGGDWPTTRFGLPENLKGTTVLDIGCYDGFFSFEAEKRGGCVTPVDLPLAIGKNDRKAFNYLANAINSKLQIQDFDIENPTNYWQYSRYYDVVLCYGVLYHLENPLGAMHTLFNLTAKGGMCLIETAISTIGPQPALEYRPNAEGDPTNRFVPNAGWVELASKVAGFTSCEKIFEGFHRATFRLTK